VNFFSKLVNTWQSYKQERDCLQHFLRLLAVYWPGVLSVWDNVIQQPMPHYLLAAMQPLSPCRPITGHRGRRHLATSLFRYRLLLLLLPHWLKKTDYITVQQYYKLSVTDQSESGVLSQQQAAWYHLHTTWPLTAFSHQSHTHTYQQVNTFSKTSIVLQWFDTVGWTSGRTPGL